MSVRVDLLGDPVVHVPDHEPVPLGTTLDDALLTVLAVHAGPASRAWLAGLFWPDASERKARANLRRRLHRVRSRPYADGLTADRTAVHWPVACDARDLLQAREAHDHDRVLNLAGGRFLNDLRFGGGPALDAWCRETRYACMRAWREAALRAVQRVGGDERAADAASHLARVLDHEPMDEALVQAYLAGAAAAGRRDDALRRYARFADLLRDRLELEPRPETRRLADALTNQRSVLARPAADDAGPPSTSTPARAAEDSDAFALPTNDTAFVGREVELGRIAAWLFDGDERWATVTGPGGIGKTRLVSEALRAAAPALPGPVRFVRAADAADENDLARRIVRALQPGALAGADPRAQARRAVVEASGVLVLDGTERLVGRLEWLRSALAASRGLRVIATSRVRPRRPDTRVMPLGGLKAPDPEAIDPHGSYYRPPNARAGFGPNDPGAPDDGAVRLFETVAERVAGPLAWDADARAAVARICRLLDGVPLAIELAAAWIRTLDPHALEAELRSARHEPPQRAERDGAEAGAVNDGTDPRTDLDRVLATTWTLLDERTRRTIEALAVFRGGFDRDAARAVAGAELRDLADAIDASLLDRSGDRYHLLEPARRFAERRLERDPDRAASLRTAHLRWAAETAREEASTLYRPRTRDAALRLLPEVENLRAAWAHALRTHDARALADLSPAVSEAWDLQGRYREGAELFARAEPLARPDRPGAEPGTGSGAYAWNRVRYAWFAFQSGRYDAARDPARDAYARFSALAGDDASAAEDAAAARGAGTAAYLLAVAAAATGDVPDARAWFLTALDRHRAAGDRAGAARAESGLGQLERTAGRPERARELLERSLAARDATGDDRGVVAVSGELASLQLAMGDVDEAARTVRRALHRARLHADAWGEAILLHHRAAVAAARGETDAAERDFMRAIARLDRAGHRYAATLPREGLGDLWRATRPQRALRPWAEALRTALDIGAAPRALSMLARLGEVRAEEAPDQAIVWLQATVAHPAVPSRARDRAGVALVRTRDRIEPERFEAGVRRGERTSLEEAGEAAWRWARVAGGSAPSFAFDAG